MRGLGYCVGSYLKGLDLQIQREQARSFFRNEQFTRQIKYAWNEGDEDREIVGTQGVED